MGISLTPEEQFEVFGTDKVGGEWADDARDRWGDTDAYRESQRRTAGYSEQDWVEIKAETDANEAGFAEAMRNGEPADSPRVRDLVEAHRAGVSRFWDCSPEAHKNLADMYLADERFRKHYDDIAPGLAQYINTAINAY